MNSLLLLILLVSSTQPPVNTVKPKADTTINMYQAQRYQIISSTKTARDTILIDTWTGTTWLYCHDNSNKLGWCPMFGGPTNDPN